MSYNNAFKVHKNITRFKTVYYSLGLYLLITFKHKINHIKIFILIFFYLIYILDLASYKVSLNRIH